ncbi:hypothetical protein Lwal_2161 [Legionella waltersii]|uniref:Uncharacterized protein n=1 Tax=Legionella waltersii TaxID=66969 RepID=A0A0W1A4Z4_9GAMM|nr:hypothetical protein Lwal_2161 [Legionella waltersii]SNV14456.1 Uncharacterised protein [Legionella waltersii]
MSEGSTHFLKWGIYTKGRVFRLMVLPQAASLGSSIRPTSLRLLTRAARFLLCCLNQILVTAGKEPSRARQQADTKLSVLTNDPAYGSTIWRSAGPTLTNHHRRD